VYTPQMRAWRLERGRAGTYQQIAATGLRLGPQSSENDYYLGSKIIVPNFSRFACIYTLKHV
jgi:hypothetical protein